MNHLDLIRLEFDEMCKASVYLPKDIEKIQKVFPVYHEMRVVVEDTNSFAAASELSQSGKTLVLSFCHPYKPGGDVRSGAQAQEECLCRQSSLLLSIRSEWAAPYYRYNRSLKDYNMSSNAAIISPHVRVFEDVENMQLAETFCVGVISCAAPIYSKKNAIEQVLYNRAVAKRIHGMLAVAAQEQYENLVLGAWGCGVFGNDPARMAKIFHQQLRKCPWFKNVVFAIPKHIGAEIPNDNHTIFASEFG